VLTQYTCKQLKRIPRIRVIVGCIVSLAIIALGFLPVHVIADNGKIPVELQAKLFLTALTYEKNMKEKTIRQFDIGILYFPWLPESKKEALLFSKALNSFKNKKISGRSFNVFLFTYNGDTGIKEAIAHKHVEVLFIAEGKERNLKEIIQLTRSENILSWTNKTEYVASCGVTIGVGLKENKPKIYLNLSSAKEEGADFSAKFLRIAEIVDSE
jgi:hypothetical protein